MNTTGEGINNRAALVDPSFILVVHEAHYFGCNLTTETSLHLHSACSVYYVVLIRIYLDDIAVSHVIDFRLRGVPRHFGAVNTYTCLPTGGGRTIQVIDTSGGPSSVLTLVKYEHSCLPTGLGGGINKPIAVTGILPCSVPTNWWSREQTR